MPKNVKRVIKDGEVMEVFAADSYETPKQRREKMIDQNTGKEKMYGPPLVVVSRLSTKDVMEERMRAVLIKHLSKNNLLGDQEFESFEDAMDFDTGEDADLKGPYDINEEELYDPREAKADEIPDKNAKTTNKGEKADEDMEENGKSIDNDDNRDGSDSSDRKPSGDDTHANNKRPGKVGARKKPAR